MKLSSRKNAQAKQPKWCKTKQIDPIPEICEVLCGFSSDLYDLIEKQEDRAGQTGVNANIVFKFWLLRLRFDENDEQWNKIEAYVHDELSVEKLISGFKLFVHDTS